MAGIAIQERFRLMERMRETFRQAAKRRNELTTWEQRDDESQPAWVFWEREKMHEAVNGERIRRGFPVVPIQEIRRVERWATGHVDYADKFAIYCTELALGERPVP